MNRSDSLFHAKAFEDAAFFYQVALGHRPNDPDAQFRLKKCKDSIQVIQQNQKKLISQGDSCWIINDTICAIDYWQKARFLNPISCELIQREEWIHGLENSDCRLEDLLFNQSIAQADLLFLNKEYYAAFLKYSHALRLKPEATYLEDKKKICQEYWR